MKTNTIYSIAKVKQIKLLTQSISENGICSLNQTLRLRMTRTPMDDNQTFKKKQSK
jgi:hypothetical protein